MEYKNQGLATHNNFFLYPHFYVAQILFVAQFHNSSY